MYNQKFKLINNTFENSKFLCTGVLDPTSIQYCNQSLSFIEFQLSNLNSKFDSIHTLIGHKRVKRGWFDGIGKVFKTVFGTMDAEDAKYYDQTIEDIQNGERNLLDVVKEQMSVVKATIANFNETMNILKFSEKQFNENINKFNNISKNIADKLNKISLSEQENQHIAMLTYLTNELNEECDNLINSILFAKRNILHPSIITPIQLINELDSNSNLLPKGISFPIPINVEYAHILSDIISLQVYYIENKLVFVINIPLSNEQEFNLYRIFPLPVPHRNINDGFAYIQPNYNYIAITANLILYHTFNSIDECKSIAQQHYLCTGNTFYSMQEKSICESLLFRKTLKSIPNACNTKRIYGDLDILQPLNSNRWIIVSSKPKTVSILCDNTNNIMDDTLVGTN